MRWHAAVGLLVCGSLLGGSLSCSDHALYQPSPLNISFLQPGITVREGEVTPPDRVFRLPIVRGGGTGSVNVPLEVRYETASAGDLGPYGRPTARTLTFDDGVDTLWLALDCVLDADIEGEERLSLCLGPPTQPYSLGHWPDLVIRIQDVGPHHDGMPSEWPLAVGSSWSYDFWWRSDCASSGDQLLAASAEVTGEMQFRGRDYRILQTSRSFGSGETWPESILLANAGDSLLFIPSTDTTLMSAGMRQSLPWVLATFSGPDSVDRVFWVDEVYHWGQQRRGGAVSVPAGSWDNTLVVRFGSGCLFDPGLCFGGGEAWTFYLAADIGPIRLLHMYCASDVGCDDCCCLRDWASLRIGPTSR